MATNTFRPAEFSAIAAARPPAPGLAGGAHQIVFYFFHGQAATARRVCAPTSDAERHVAVAAGLAWSRPALVAVDDANYATWTEWGLTFAGAEALEAAR